MKKRIFVVDDNSEMCNAVKHALDKSGRFEAMAESDHMEPLERMVQFKPDLLVLDIMMPDVDGTVIAEKVRGDPDFKDLPIIFLTALITEGEEWSGGSAGGKNAYLAKPFTPDQLRDICAKLMAASAVSAVRPSEPPLGGL